MARNVAWCSRRIFFGRPRGAMLCLVFEQGQSMQNSYCYVNTFSANPDYETWTNKVSVTIRPVQHHDSVADPIMLAEIVQNESGASRFHQCAVMDGFSRRRSR